MIARELEARRCEVTRRERPDVALVGWGESSSSAHALELIGKIVHEAACPVIALLDQKGILMAIHGVDERKAFDMLRSQSQQNGRKLIDLAEAVVRSHRLLITKGSASGTPPT